MVLKFLSKVLAGLIAIGAISAIGAFSFMGGTYIKTFIELYILLLVGSLCFLGLISFIVVNCIIIDKLWSYEGSKRKKGKQVVEKTEKKRSRLAEKDKPDML